MGREALKGEISEGRGRKGRMGECRGVLEKQRHREENWSLE